MTKKLIYGVGINDSEVPLRETKNLPRVNGKQKQIILWVCPCYFVWCDLLRRCYAKNAAKKFPAYKDCFVCEEWLTFSNFKAWMLVQDYEGKQLDKDLLVRGNREYSPEKCIFVTSKVNNFILEGGRNSTLPIGMTARYGKYQAQCKNVITNTTTYLGTFADPQEAHSAWLVYKTKQAYILAGMQTDERVAKALIERYENYDEWEKQID